MKAQKQGVAEPWTTMQPYSASDLPVRYLHLPDLKTFAGPDERPQVAWPKTTGEKSEMQSRASRKKDGAVPWDCLALEDRQGCLGGLHSPALLPC